MIVLKSPREIEEIRRVYRIVAEILAVVPPAQRLRLPMRPGQRSLNLSNAVAVAVYEAWRQQGYVGSG